MGCFDIPYFIKKGRCSIKYSYKTCGTCSSQIDFEFDGDVIKNVRFTRGCNGNTQGIAALVEGMHADDVIRKLKGTDCGGRGTSCPDQLARAIEAAKSEI